MEAEKKKNIFLVAYGGGHVAMLSPIAKELMARGYAVTFLALTTAAAYLRKENVPHIGYKDLPGAADADVEYYGRKLSKSLTINGAVDIEETVAYLGLNYRELVQDVGEEKAENIYQELGRRAFLPIKLFEKIFSNKKPDLVVATNSPRSEQAALIAAGNKGIPCICAVDVFGVQEVRWIGKPGYADRICVLNENVRQMFLAAGRKENEVLVTGNPAFDALKSTEKINFGRILRKKYDCNSGEKIILWASQRELPMHPFSGRKGDEDLPRKIESSLREFIANYKQYKLVIRYHPSEVIDFKEGQENVFFSSPEEDLNILLNAVDIVVVTASTVGLQAYISGRKVISVDSTIYQSDAPYSEMGISEGVFDVKYLPSKILSISHQGRMERINEGAEDIKYKNSAVENVVEVIESLV